jgi:hypothetical protein
MTKTQHILNLIQEAAINFRAFERRGPGAGNRITNQVMAYINQRVRREFGPETVEPVLGADAKQAVDFYVREEGTAIEVEFSLCNPYPCLEKDALKVLLAIDNGHPIHTLVLVGDPGCHRRLAAPAPRAIIGWLRRKHNLEVKVVELQNAHII